jgi:peptidoglycan-associated lipoprotein
MRSSLATFALLSLGLVACGGDPKPEPKSAAPTSEPQKQAAPQGATDVPAKDRADAGTVRIDDAIRAACGDLPSASFDFDSAALSPSAGQAFASLAKCFTTGALKGRTLRVVGHTDSRGEAQYNIALGHRRAGSVSALLAQKGMDKGRLETSSKGAIEATGTDDEGMARDRRVDLFLAPAQ